MVQQAEMEQLRRSNMISSDSKEDQDGYLGVAIHSQVKKIKQEMEKIKHPSLQQPEMRPVLKEISTAFRQRSRSPLGLAEKRPISVGN